jgi:hypothetical protein
MHHAQENQHPQRLPGPRMHTRCILSGSTRNTMACNAFVAQSHVVTYLHRKACMPPHPTTTHHKLQPPFHPCHPPFPSPTLPYHRLSPFANTAHASSPRRPNVPIPIRFIVRYPVERTIPRFSVCDSRRRDDAVSIRCYAEGRREGGDATRRRS